MHQELSHKMSIARVCYYAPFMAAFVAGISQKGSSEDVGSCFDAFHKTPLFSVYRHVSAAVWCRDLDFAQHTLCSYVCLFYELFETLLWHLIERLRFKCSHTVNVSNLFHGLPIEE